MPAELELAGKTRSQGSPELQFVLTCLDCPLTDANVARIRASAAAVGQWDHVLAIAKRHRVVGLVYRACFVSKVSVSAAVQTEFASEAKEAASAAMKLTFEAARLRNLLQAAHVTSLFLKGTTLSVLAYEDPSLRHSKDIDLLIAREELEEAGHALRKAGYMERISPERIGLKRYAQWIESTKGTEWFHPVSRTEVELHWQLTDLPLSLPTLHDLRQRQIRITAGIEFPTLPRRDLLIYLCVHGASHAWSRLKWLADVHALLAPYNADELVSLQQDSQRCGTGRMTAQALLLREQYFACELPDSLRKTFKRDWRLRLVTRIAGFLIQQGGAARELSDRRFASTLLYLSRPLLGRGWRFALKELSQSVRAPEHQARAQAPASFSRLYPIIRLGGWCKQRLFG